ncbi:amidohydrolase family protein [Nakamurella lactea]|uniref:amidohydrolase family protein n=1 Tax=Nakamurella lactea TaxID=459515 RepID=UPI000408B576|nr:amidohydrolase family protein [Nakamurella lactea]
MVHSARNPAPDAQRSGAERPIPAGPVPIDVHAHAVPGLALAALRAAGRRREVEVLQMDAGIAVSVAGRVSPPIPPALLTANGEGADRRTVAMDRAGIGCQLLSPWMELTPVGMSGQAGRWYAAAINESLAAEVADSAGRFEGLGMVPLTDPDGAVAELHRCLDLGLAGVEIATSLPGLRLDDASLEPFWQAASARRAVVLLHPFRPFGGAQSDRLGDIVGNPAETAVAVGRLLLDGLLDRLPELRLCAVHGGGVLPYLAGRLAAMAELDGRPGRGATVTAGLDRLYFDSLTHSTRSLGWLLEFAGPGRVLLGSDYPFETGCPDPLASVDALPALAAADRAALVGGTARRLLADVRH